MPTNYEILEDAINSIPSILKPNIIEIPIEGGKKLFLVNNNYDGLPPQIRLHYNRIEPEMTEKIIKEMNENQEFKVFCCIDFQDFINIMSDIVRFRKIFIGRNISQSVLDETVNEFCEDYEDLGIRKADLKIISAFGFSEYRNRSIENVAEEPCCKLYSILQEYYYKKTIELMGRNYRFDFNKNIISPFHKLMSIVSKEDCLNTDNRHYSFIEPDLISDRTIQNLFICMQFHTFFEEYVTSHFPNGRIIKNPLVLINPTVKADGTIDGYFELDGAFLIDENKQLTFIESKNSRLIKVEHLTHLIGKTNLIERVYDLNVKKLLFSTGERHWIWKGIESKYGKMDDIKIFDLSNFRNGFNVTV